MGSAVQPMEVAASEWEMSRSGLRRLLNSHDLIEVEGVRQYLDIGTGLPTADNTHAASDIGAATAAAMARTYNATSSLTITPRDRATVARFFDGLEMTSQGLMPLDQWQGLSLATSAPVPASAATAA
jgi:hypothetical protein